MRFRARVVPAHRAVPAPREMSGTVGAPSRADRVQDTRLRVQDTRLRVQDTRLRVQDTRLRVQDTRLRVQDTRLRVQDTRLRVQDTRLRVQDTRGWSASAGVSPCSRRGPSGSRGPACGRTC
ncbi:hypothetical protein LY40_002239 [Prauserella salsuginis]|nr:hypothetical protein [Prauserella salsuginis]